MDVSWWVVLLPFSKNQGVRNVAEWVPSALGWYRLSRTPRRVLIWVETYWGHGQNRKRVSPGNPMGKTAHRREVKWLRVGGSEHLSTLAVCVFCGGRPENHTDLFCLIRAILFVIISIIIPWIVNSLFADVFNYRFKSITVWKNLVRSSSSCPKTSDGKSVWTDFLVAYSIYLSACTLWTPSLCFDGCNKTTNCIKLIFFCKKCIYVMAHGKRCLQLVLSRKLCCN